MTIARGYAQEASVLVRILFRKGDCRRSLTASTCDRRCGQIELLVETCHFNVDGEPEKERERGLPGRRYLTAVSVLGTDTLKAAPSGSTP